MNWRWGDFIGLSYGNGGIYIDQEVGAVVAEIHTCFPCRVVFLCCLW